MKTILDQIVETKWGEITAAQAARPLASLEAQLSGCASCRGFTAALKQPGPIRVIAEVKKASPSAGIIRADFDPVAVAKTYEAHGATCLSVLTDEQYFQGHLDYLKAIRQAVKLPLLRKEFILDRYQLVEARVAGADAVLLIAEILPGDRLKELYAQAVTLGLDVLVEIHDPEDLSRVLDSGTKLLGINNRDLRHFTTRLEHTLDLLPRIPKQVAVVSESGIRSHSDLEKLEKAGVSAVLVGESLMRAPDIGLALDQLRGQRL